MALRLILGPPNSGRVALIRERFAAALERDPILVVPNEDERFRMERELCERGAALGGSVMTFGALFRTVAIVSGSPPGPELTESQRLRLIEIALAAPLGPLRRSAERPGFALAFRRLLDELQRAGIDPDAMQAGTGTLEGSAYLSDIASLFAAYAKARDALGRVDSHQIAAEAIALLRDSGDFWRERPVFLYGLDDLTPNQFELVAALCDVAEVTIALPYEKEHAILGEREALLDKLRERIGGTEEILPADPRNTKSSLLFHLERSFGTIDTETRPPDEGLTLLRSAGERAEAEAVGVEMAKLISTGADPAEIALVLRDSARRGPPIAAVLESYGIATALEAELPASGTAVGGCLIALLEAEFGARRASDLLRFLRGPSGVPSYMVDRLEARVRGCRVRDAATALELWRGEGGALPDLERVRKAAHGPRTEFAEVLARIVAKIAERARAAESEEAGAETGSRAIAAIASTLADMGALGERSPSPQELIGVLKGLTFRAWSGPVGGRVRIAEPRQLRASRFDHVFVASLQDGEFPRRDRGGDPFLSDRQRDSLGLDPRHDTDAEERYLFYSSISLPRKRLYLSYRDSNESGGAEARSPLIDEVRRLLDPPPGIEEPDPVEESITRGRDLAQVVHPVVEAPSVDELARAIAARGATADPAESLAAAGVDGETGRSVDVRLAAARAADAASRAPGPLANTAVIESLAAVGAYGGTTLEEFDLCSYRWFAAHELDPQPLDPKPDPLVQGGLMHATLDRLYKERPGGDPLPRPNSLPAWIERGRELVIEIAAERELGDHPSERAVARRVERLLCRFLAEEARRETGGFEPWLLEAGFGEQEGSERPVLTIDGWGLHGAIDRVDRAGDGSALVLDYKLAGSVTPRDKFEEKAKLQLQLYLIAVAEHWGGRPVGGLYHPLRGTSERRPRGAVLEDFAEELGSYGIVRTDLVDEEGLEELLADARRRAGEIVARMRSGEIRRDPGPRKGLRGYDTCPAYCDFAPICRRDRAPVVEEDFDVEER